MDAKTKKYMAKIGSKGGKKSRRTLDPETARTMVKLREARRAYKKYYAQCFWSFNPDMIILKEDLNWVAKYLCKNGNREMWELAMKICL